MQLPVRSDKFVLFLTSQIENSSSININLFILQYQYMPFLLAALAIVYYIPYIFFGIACNDLINLEKDLKKKISNAKAIHSSYFGGKYVGTFKKHNGIERSFWHYVVIWLVKIAYIAVSIAVFYMFDYILGKTFFMYGGQWWNWSRQNNTQQHDYMGSREFPKPGMYVCIKNRIQTGLLLLKVPHTKCRYLKFRM